MMLRYVPTRYKFILNKQMNADRWNDLTFTKYLLVGIKCQLNKLLFEKTPVGRTHNKINLMSKVVKHRTIIYSFR